MTSLSGTFLQAAQRDSTEHASATNDFINFNRE